MRDINSRCFIIRARNRLLIERFDAELLRLLELAAGVGAGDQAAVFLLTDPATLRAEPLERRLWPLRASSIRACR